MTIATATPPRTTLLRAAALAVCLAATPFPASAQMGSLADPLATAVPADQRPVELRGAKDMIRGGNAESARLYVDLAKPATACGKPGAKVRAGAKCAQTGALRGRVRVGDVWSNNAVAWGDVERLWLLHSRGVWSTDKLRRVDAGLFEFDGGPDWPAMEPVDVVVRIKGSTDLLQVRFQRPYLQGG
jgi:hypothetical protein